MHWGSGMRNEKGGGVRTSERHLAMHGGRTRGWRICGPFRPTYVKNRTHGISK